jgi:hypothetical protein
MSMDGPYCSNCGSALPADASFCSRCGQRVEGAALAAPPPLVGSMNRPADPARITEEDAERIARAHTLEQGRNIWRGCGIGLVVFAVLFVVLYVIIILFFS